MNTAQAAYFFHRTAAAAENRPQLRHAILHAGHFGQIGQDICYCIRNFWNNNAMMVGNDEYNIMRIINRE